MFSPRLLPRTLAACLRDVKHKKLEVRLAAVRDLARHASSADSKPARSALCDALANDSAVAVRAEAAVGLADAGAREHLDELCDALEDEALRVRQMALVAVGELSTTEDKRALCAVKALLRDAAPELRFQALIGARKLLPAPEFLAEVATAQKDEDDEVRYIALRLAEEVHADDETVPRALLNAALIGARDDSPRVRLIAALVLVRAEHSSGTELLADLLNRIRLDLSLDDEAAAIALAGQHGIEAALPGLQRRAFGGLLSSSPLQWQARIALAQLGDPRARKTILGGLSAWTRDGRTLAVVAAGKAGLAEARKKIEALGASPRGADPEAVAQALQLLKEVDEP